MTIPEAARLVLQAGAIGETGQVYVLDMGEPVRIVDLARDLIRMSGHPLNEIRIVYSGLRPGEKLYEELLADADSTLATAHPRLRIALLNPADAPGLMADLATGLEAYPPRLRRPRRQAVAARWGAGRPAQPRGRLWPARPRPHGPARPGCAGSASRAAPRC